MRRRLPWLFVTTYLAALGWGIVSHTVGYGSLAHAGMYYVVWDMFCGWNAYSTRMEIIGEGESGKFYRLAPGPWGEFHPYGSLDRRHYDTSGRNCGRTALNTLRHTRHEPIVRFYTVEEAWAKKYNLPDAVWAHRFDESKDVRKYHHVRAVYGPDGSVERIHPDFLGHQAYLAVAENPRLSREYHQGRPFWAPSPGTRMALADPIHSTGPAATAEGASGRTVTPPLGP